MHKSSLIKKASAMFLTSCIILTGYNPVMGAESAAGTISTIADDSNNTEESNKEKIEKLEEEREETVTLSPDKTVTPSPSATPSSDKEATPSIMPADDKEQVSETPAPVPSTTPESDKETKPSGTPSESPEDSSSPDASASPSPSISENTLPTPTTSPEGMEEDGVILDEDGGITAYAFGDTTEDSVVAKVGSKTGTFRAMCEYAMETGQELTMTDHANITSPIVVDRPLKINTGFSISLVGNQTSENGDNIFYIDGGSLELNSTGGGRLMGKKTDSEGSAIYINKGSCKVSNMVLHGRSSKGKASVVYIGKEGMFTTEGQIIVVESIDADTSTGYAYISNPTQPLIWVDGNLQVGTQEEASHLYFMYGGYLMCGINMPENGLDFNNYDTSYAYRYRTIKIDSETMSKNIISGESAILQKITPYNSKCSFREENGSILIEMEGQAEASCGDNYGTFSQMIALASSNGGTQEVKLYVNLNPKEQIDIYGGIDLTINLQGHILSRTDNSGIERGRFFGVYENSTLRLINGTITGGRSTASGGSVFVSRGANFETSSLTIADANAKKGKAVYAEAEGSINIGNNTILEGSGDLIYTKKAVMASESVSMPDGYIYFDSSEIGTNPMISYSGNSLRVMSDMPVVLSSSPSGSFVPADESIAVVPYNGKTIIMQTGSNQAQFDLTGNGETVSSSLKNIWLLARFYKKGTVKLLEDIKADIGSEGTAPSRPLWGEQFSQMATGIGANITFDFNGHTMDADMINLIQKIEALGADRKFGTNFVFIVNNESSLTLKDSAGGGGIKNVVSGTAYPAAVHVEGESGKDSYLYFDNVAVTGCYSGKGALYAANQYSHIKISGKSVIKGNQKITSDTVSSGSLSVQQLNLLIEDNTDISSAGVSDLAEIGLSPSSNRMSTAVSLMSGETAGGFFADDDKHAVVAKNGYACFVNKDAYAQVSYEAPNGTKKTLSFDDAWNNYAKSNGGKITLLTNFTISDVSYSYSGNKELIVDFNGKTITVSSSKGILFNVSGNATFTDSHQADKSEVASSLGTSGYDSNTGRLTYYTSVVKGESNKADNTTSKKLVVTKHIDRISSVGGIISPAGGYIFSGSATISGGKYSSKSGFATNFTGKISNVYIFQTGGSNLIQSSGKLSIENCVIACNTTKTPISVNSLIIKDSIISGNDTGNTSSAQGIIYINRGNLNMQNSHISYNKAQQGGAIYCNTGTAVITDSYINGNDATTGGGIFVYNSDLTIENSQISGNTASSNGGGLFANSNIKMTGSDISLNSANYGGGINYCTEDGITLSNNEIDGNTAKVGGGIYVGSNGLILKDDISMVGNSDTGLYVGSGIKVDATELASGYIPFKTADVPTRQKEIPVADTGTNEKAQELIDKKVMVSSPYMMNSHDNTIWLTVDPNADYGEITVQYYAYTNDIYHNAANNTYTSLPVIDTSRNKSGVALSKAQLPKNNQSITDIGNGYLYLENTTNTKKNIYGTNTLVPIFNSKRINQNQVNTISETDLFKKNEMLYKPTEIWVLKGNNPESINRNDFNIYTYNPDMLLDFKPDSVVRIVCEEESGTYQNEAVFYDYDISDGYWYSSDTNARNQISRNEMSTLSYSATRYIYTQGQGINHPDNYKEPNKPHLAFGNSNAGSGYDTVLWQDADGNSLKFNQGNRSSKYIRLCTFGIPKSLDENGNIEWQQNMTTPNLFNEGTAIGKTTFTGNNIIFKKQGNTYTMSATDGFSLTDLDKLMNVAGTWTNNFWPMDKAPTWGANGHDPKMGASSYNTRYVGMANNVNASSTLPPSDDKTAHNFYFGMQFAMTFELPEDYIGPLDYWLYGDKEMFMFLDDKLVCDLGGVHISVGEYVNLWNYIEKGDTSKHTLSFFYTDRGGSGSTCWMRFTVPNIKPATRMPHYMMYRFKTVDENENGIPNTEFSLSGGSTNLAVTSDENGFITFDNLNESTIYTVMETKTASGKYILDNTKYHLEFINGAWVMYSSEDASKHPVIQVVNAFVKEDAKLPETGGTGNNKIYMLSSLLLIAGLILLNKYKK